MISIGVDMHKRSWHVTALAEIEDLQVRPAVAINRDGRNALIKKWGLPKNNLTIYIARIRFLRADQAKKPRLIGLCDG